MSQKEVDAEEEEDGQQGEIAEFPQTGIEFAVRDSAGDQPVCGRQGRVLAEQVFLTVYLSGKQRLPPGEEGMYDIPLCGGIRILAAHDDFPLIIEDHEQGASHGGGISTGLI